MFLLQNGRLIEVYHHAKYIDYIFLMIKFEQVEGDKLSYALKYL